MCSNNVLTQRDICSLFLQGTAAPKNAPKKKAYKKVKNRKKTKMRRLGTSRRQQTSMACGSVAQNDSLAGEQPAAPSNSEASQPSRWAALVAAVITAIACSSSLLSSSLAARLSMAVLALSLPIAAAAAAPAVLTNVLAHRHLMTPVSSWTDSKSAIEAINSSSSGAFTFATDFDCNYNEQITISGEVTVDGGDAVCDANQGGKFYYIEPGASFTLTSITLQNGDVSDQVRSVSVM